jgi:hypothetical protein
VLRSLTRLLELHSHLSHERAKVVCRVQACEHLAKTFDVRHTLGDFVPAKV